jgi:hypothetical protein
MDLEVRTMNLLAVADFLLWCAILNYLILLFWFALFSLAHDWMFRLLGRWFQITVAQFDSLNFAAMTAYKVGILLLNLVPYIALNIAARHSG